MQEEISEALTKIKNTINCKLVKEIKMINTRENSIFKELKDGSKHKSVVFMFSDLAI